MPKLPLRLCLFLGAIALACGPTGVPGPGEEPGNDEDSDGDTISDAHENRSAGFDTDQDGTPDYLDDDSDGDCIPDALEAGDDDLSTPPADTDGDGTHDAMEVDSDGDGLADGKEDTNCNGQTDGDETSAVKADTDGDGASDLVENATETDALNPDDNPAANGDFVFVMPYQESPTPKEDDLGFSTELQKVDLYVLVDRSGSMRDEINSIRNNMQSVIKNLTCPPLGNGTPGECIQDIWSGAGTFTYAERDPFVHRIDIQPNPDAIKQNLPGSDTNSCGACAEPHMLAAFSVATGQGTSGGACGNVDSYQDRFSCSGSPAGATGIGYPCFRSESLPVILLATDEPPSTQYSCPGFDVTAQAASAIGAKIIGIRGSGGDGDRVKNDLNQLAQRTGAVDANGNPLVFKGHDSGAAAAIENGIRALSNSIPLDISPRAVDDAADSVDTVSAFIDHLETLQAGTPECSDGLMDADSDGDGHPDAFNRVITGTPVCWKLIPKMNTTVEGTDEPQLFRAAIQVYGDGVSLLDTRNVFFIVPPQLVSIL